MMDQSQDVMMLLGLVANLVLIDLVHHVSLQSELAQTIFDL